MSVFQVQIIPLYSPFLAETLMATVFTIFVFVAFFQKLEFLA